MNEVARLFLLGLEGEERRVAADLANGCKVYEVGRIVSRGGWRLYLARKDKGSDEGSCIRGKLVPRGAERSDVSASKRHLRLTAAELSFWPAACVRSPPTPLCNLCIATPRDRGIIFNGGLSFEHLPRNAYKRLGVRISSFSLPLFF